MTLNLGHLGSFCLDPLPWWNFGWFCWSAKNFSLKRIIPHRISIKERQKSGISLKFVYSAEWNTHKDMETIYISISKLSFLPISGFRGIYESLIKSIKFFIIGHFYFANSITIHKVMYLHTYLLGIWLFWTAYVFTEKQFCTGSTHFAIVGSK